MPRALRRFSYEAIDKLVTDKFQSWDRFLKEVYAKTGVFVSNGSPGNWKDGARPSIDVAEAMCFVLDVARDEITEVSEPAKAR